jgi:putative serine protease PepD
MTSTPFAPYDSTTPYGWPAPPAEPEPQPPREKRPRARTAALALALMIGSGAAGGALALGLHDEPAAPVAGAATIQRAASGGTAAVTAGTPQSAAATIGPSVVTIRVSGTATTQTPFGNQQQQVSGTGSGVVLNKDGYIVTNNHVVSAAVGGGTVSVLFSDGTSADAEIIGTDPTSDLAVIKVAASAELTPATFADSDDLVVGQAVLAVGAPLGLSNTVTEGIVSTLNRPVRTGESGASEQSVIDAVQTDAAINPGNSGGALVGLDGKVVGLNSAIATAGSGSSGNIGVGFAIPSNTVSEVAQELIKDGSADHPQLGVSLGATTDGSGALVTQVSGPAAAAGLKPGDVITKIGDRPVTDADSLIVAVRDHQPGESVTVTYVRDSQTRTASATLATAPSE